MNRNWLALDENLTPLGAAQPEQRIHQFFMSVRYVSDYHIRRTQLTQDAEQVVGFLFGQGRIWLVEDKHLSLDRQGLRNIDHLLLRQRKLSDRLAHIDILDTKLCQRSLG